MVNKKASFSKSHSRRSDDCSGLKGVERTCRYIIASAVTSFCFRQLFFRNLILKIDTATAKVNLHPHKCRKCTCLAVSPSTPYPVSPEISRENPKILAYSITEKLHHSTHTSVVSKRILNMKWNRKGEKGFARWDLAL